MPYDAIHEIDRLRGSWPYLKERSTGWWVRLLIRALRIHGYPIGIQDVFGPGVLAAVRSFQLDNNLQTDGVVGPQTWNALSYDPKEPFVPIAAPLNEVDFLRQIDRSAVRFRLVTIAQALMLLPVRESRTENNRGEVVDALNKHAAKMVGIPWCAAFADFCTDVAYDSTGFVKPFDVGVSSSRIYREAEQFSLVRNPDQARPGDLGLVPGGPTGWQHTFIIEGVDSDKKRITTIEGNIDLPNDNQGQGIFRRRRNIISEKLAIISVTD